MKTLQRIRPDVSTQLGGAEPIGGIRSPLLAGSIAVFVVGMVSTVVGLFDPVIYSGETEDWRSQAIGQDLVNLVAFPMIAVLAVRAVNGSARAFAMWAGLVAYLSYTFAIYSFAVGFGPLFLAYVAVLGWSTITLVVWIPKVLPSLTPREDVAAARVASRLLLGIGVLFSFLWLSEILPALWEGTQPDALRSAGLTTNPVHVLDLALLLPAAVWIGVAAGRGALWAWRLAPIMLVTLTWLSLGIVSAMLTYRVRGGDLAPVPLSLVGLLMVAEVLVARRCLRSWSS